MRLSALIDGIYTESLPAAFQDFDVVTLTCDSREAGQDGLFVALSGFNFKGDDFIKDALAKGAKVIVKGRGGVAWGQDKKICVLEVDDPKDFLRQIGQRFYGYPSRKIKSIGVTGTNGKTTVTYLIESIIHAASRRCGVIGTVNYRIGGAILP